MTTTNSTSTTLASVSRASGASSSSPTSSGNLINTASSLFSSTFSAPDDPFPTPTGGGGGGSGSVNNSNPSIASSAGLYLYTFLATLVLLLSVSAAIILRSLLLRRRHRRMVEEAIANGTWVPPSPTAGGLGGRPARVDLSRKPKMWEAFVGDDAAHGEKARHTHRMERETEWDWDSIRPFSASYVPKPKSPATSTPLPQSDPASPPPEQPRIPVMHRLRQIISPTPATPMVPLPSSSLGSHANSSPNLVEEDDPKKIRVAVLIAMPSQLHSQYGHSQSRSRSPSQLNTHSYSQASKTPSPLTLSPSSSSSPSPSPSSPHPPQSLPHPLSPSSTPTPPEEPELPHLEFGVAELAVRQDTDDREDDGGEGSEEVRKSVGSSVDVV